MSVCGADDLCEEKIKKDKKEEWEKIMVVLVVIWWGDSNYTQVHEWLANLPLHEMSGAIAILLLKFELYS